MRQAATIQAAADLSLYDAVARAECEELAVSPKPLPDRQTLQIAELLPRREPGSPPAICLDLGAGLGRVASELKKLSQPKIQSLRWACWGPDAAAREKLRTALEGHPFAYAVELDEVADGSVDVAVLMNVLHVCTPPAAAELIEVAARKLKPDTGALVVSEIYPLLRAERFAVPYPQDAIIDVFNGLGYLSASRSFKVFSPLIENAHCTTCRITPEARAKTHAEIVATFEREWDKILGRAVKSYAALGPIRGYADYQATLQDMTTIASVNAYRAGVWR